LLAIESLTATSLVSFARGRLVRLALVAMIAAGPPVAIAPFAGSLRLLTRVFR
jgi:hypothetical protein